MTLVTAGHNAPTLADARDLQPKGDDDFLEYEALVDNTVEELWDGVVERSRELDALDGRERFNALNALAKECNSDNNVMNHVAGVYRDLLHRDLGPAVSAAELRLLMAIYDRTLGWAGAKKGVKIADTIRMSEVVYGRLTDQGHDRLTAAREQYGQKVPADKVRWRNGDFETDTRGICIFSGVGMTEATIRTTVKALEARGMIGVIRWGPQGAERVAYYLGANWLPALMVSARVNSRVDSLGLVQRAAVMLLLANPLTEQHLRSIAQDVVEKKNERL